MSKLLFLFLLFVSVKGLSQPGDSLIQRHGNQSPVIFDSVLRKPGIQNDSVINMSINTDSLLFKESMERNMNSILELQRDHRAREKRNAIIRIGIGVAFLIVLIIGLRRKAVKK